MRAVDITTHRDRTAPGARLAREPLRSRAPATLRRMRRPWSRPRRWRSGATLRIGAHPPEGEEARRRSRPLTRLDRSDRRPRRTVIPSASERRCNGRRRRRAPISEAPSSRSSQGGRRRPLQPVPRRGPATRLEDAARRSSISARTRPSTWTRLPGVGPPMCGVAHRPGSAPASTCSASSYMSSPSLPPSGHWPQARRGPRTSRPTHLRAFVGGEPNTPKDRRRRRRGGAATTPRPTLR